MDLAKLDIYIREMGASFFETGTDECKQINLRLQEVHFQKPSAILQSSSQPAV